MSADDAKDAMEATAAQANGAKGHGASGAHELRRRLVAESLSIGNPANNAKDLPAQSDPRQECQIEVDVDDIRAYEHNPRRAINSNSSRRGSIAEYLITNAGSSVG